MSTPDPHDFELYDAVTPTLKGGEHRLTATQTLTLPLGQTEQLKTAVQRFWVTAPRFGLSPEEIQSVYPPDGQAGPFERTLPHIVFRRRTLPWEVELADAKPNKAEPWMALLVFHEKDDRLAPTAFKTMRVQDVSGQDGVRGPTLKLEPWETTSPPGASAPFGGGPTGPRLCQVMEIGGDLFNLVAPRREELPLLAHARKVKTTYREDGPDEADGWFSVVLANRLPARHPADGDAEAARNIAVLVSLEGMEDLIDRRTPPPATVRLIVLARWTFETAGEGFLEQLAKLNEAHGGDALLRIPANDRLPLDDPNVEVRTSHTIREALALGHVPLPHNLRQGDRTVSWYRGPLIPVWVSPKTENLMIGTADEFLQYDRETRMFNVSYAAAWQLGRLLALQTPEFARNLFNLASSHTAEQLLELAEREFEKRFGSASDRSLATRLHQEELMVALALEWLDAEA